MGIYSLRLPGLSLSPTVRENAQRVEARTRLWVRVLCLFGYDRRVIADAGTRVLYLLVRRWWILNAVTAVPFKDIEYVWYSFGSFPLDVAYSPFGTDPRDEMRAVAVAEADWFNIAIKIRSSATPLLLYRCVGDGGFLTEILFFLTPFALGHWLIRLVNLESDEERRSHKLATALARIIDLPLSSPLEHSILQMAKPDLVRCPVCNRELRRSAQHCVYCGTNFPHGLAGVVTDPTG